MDFVSTGVAFLVGVAVGAAGQYFADKYTDTRRAQEHRTDSVQRFQEVAATMPKLIEEMATDFQRGSADHVREFILLPSEGVTYNSGGHEVFSYYETQHANLSGQVVILENNGYVTDITSGNTPTFRASEDFVNHLRKYTPS